MQVKQTFELLQPIVSRLRRTFISQDIIDNGDGTYTLYACNTLWITQNIIITINAVQYKVIDLKANEWIKIQGAGLPTMNFLVDLPFYSHGTILAKNQEMNAEKLSENKLPMIYLHEITREEFHEDELSSIDRESDCDLYFICDANAKDWLTLDHDNYAVKPMRNLCAAFVHILKHYSGIQLITKTNVLDHANWGVYTADKGHVKQIFSDYLSGCQLKITIPFLKSLICTGCGIVDDGTDETIIPPFTPNPYMRKDVYDTDDNGIVDLAEEALNAEDNIEVYPAGENISSGFAVYVNNGLLYKYDPTNVSLYNRYIGIAKNAALTGEAVTVITQGIYEQAGFGLTPDQVYYVGLNGVLTLTPPEAPEFAISQPVGSAIDSNRIRIANYDATKLNV